ncbi:MAG: hypothetical protein ACPLPS_09495 [bacterium]
MPALFVIARLPKGKPKQSRILSSFLVIARASEGNPPQFNRRLLRRYAPRNDGEAGLLRYRLQ